MYRQQQQRVSDLVVSYRGRRGSGAQRLIPIVIVEKLKQHIGVQDGTRLF